MILDFHQIKDKNILTDISLWSGTLSFGFLNRQIDCRYSKVDFISDDFSRHPVLFLEQHHGNTIIDISNQKFFDRVVMRGDGWIIDCENFRHFVFGIKTADCIPLFMLSSDRRIACLLHCGWRSVIAKIVEVALSFFNKSGVSPSEILTYIGPGAQGCCYVIKEDLAHIFYENFTYYKQHFIENNNIFRSSNGKLFLSISNFLKMQLKSLGLISANIFATDECTICNPQYFSHRRENDIAGRQLSFICGFEPIEIIRSDG